MNIQTSKNDPPRIAFDAINRKKFETQSDWNLIRTKPAIGLVSGAQLIPRVAGSRIIRLAGTVLNRMEYSGKDFAESNNAQLVADAQKLNQARGSGYDTGELYKTLSLSQRNRLEEAQLRTRILDQQWGSEEDKTDKNESESLAINETQHFLNKLQAQNTDHRKTSEAAPNQNKRVIQGIVELKALPPPNGTDWQIQIARYDEGTKIEDARFDTRASKYSMNVSELEGSIRAKLVDVKSGEVVGEGALKISDYLKTGNGKITIAKTPNYYAANFPNYYDNVGLATRTRVSKKQPETNIHLASLDTSSKADAEGSFKFDSVHKNSWMIVRAQRKGFNESIFLSPAGEENSLPLLPEKMINAMRNIIQDQNRQSIRESNGSVIWGQAVQGEKPLKGVVARIQMDAEEIDQSSKDNSYRAIYFNQLMIPDPSMTETGENGFFAFVDVEEGFHTITGDMGGINVSHQNVVVDEGTVSTAILNSLFVQNDMEVKIFDAFTGQPETADVEMQSLPAKLEINGYSKVFTSRQHRLSLAQVFPENPKYLPSLQIYNDDDESLHLPLISNSWVEDLISQKRINRQPQLGTVVGFVRDWNFKVFLGHHSNFSNENIVYFDQQGRVVEKGIIGGGFVLFNVPIGVQSVVVSDESSEMLFNQVIPVDPSSLVELKF